MSSPNSSPTPFLTELNYTEREPSPTFSEPKRGNIYTYESAETICKRTHLITWYHVTQKLKEERYDKEFEMRQLTERNNFKMKMEVKGIMNLVIFENWRNFAVAKKAQRERWNELNAARERDEKARKIAEEKGRRKSASFRNMHYLDTVQSPKAESRERGSPRGSPKDGGRQLGLGQAYDEIEPGNKLSLLAFQKKRQKELETMNAQELQALSPYPTPNHHQNHRKLTAIRNTGPETVVMDKVPTKPLPKNQDDFCRRLSQPQNYIPPYLRRNMEEFDPAKMGDQHLTNQAKKILFDLAEKESESSTSEVTSFTDELAKMYKKYRQGLKAKEMRKKEKRKQVRMQNRDRFMKKKTEAQAEADRKFNAPTAWELEQRAELLAAQNKATERLFSGVGIQSPVNPKVTGAVRGANVKVKKSVTMMALKKEKEGMLRFLERLQKPVSREGMQ